MGLSLILSLVISLVFLKFIMFNSYFLEGLLSLEMLGLLIYMGFYNLLYYLEGGQYFLIVLLVFLIGEAALGLGLLVKGSLSHGGQSYKDFSDCMC